MATIIDGKAVAEQIKEQVKAQVARMKAEKGSVPGLATVLVGENAASQVYIRNKIKFCEATGMTSHHHQLSADTTEDNLLDLIEILNREDSVNGILVQLPLPKQINANKVLEAIDPRKDVDGFHPINVGNLSIGRPSLKSCTPYGVMKLLESIKYNPSGQNAVVIGRSNIVGKPMALMLLEASATVTICHSKTKDLPGVVRQADLVVAAVGIPHFVKGDWIKEGAVVIDVGMNRLDTGKLAGDVDYEADSKRASAITPVPGGVGPMTIAMLLNNTLEAARMQGL